MSERLFCGEIVKDHILYGVLQFMWYNLSELKKENNMTSKEKIIKTMEKKNELLKKYQKHPTYFWQKDARSIRGWREEDCSRVWDTMKYAIIEDPFSRFACPFCVQYDVACHICPYKKRHGRCSASFDYRDHFYSLGHARSMVSMYDRNELAEFCKELDKE
jgi:hypothetical protein